MTDRKLQIKYRQLDELIPYARNARTHSPEQVAQIAASIREFGWTNPILTDGQNGVVAGHGRLQAARQLGLDVVPTIDLAHLTEPQKRAYVIADNRLAEHAGWDHEMLALELEELRIEGFDLDLTGFDAAALEAMFGEWQSDIDVVEKHGENLDGIDATIRVKVDKDQKDMARDAIVKALDAVGVTYECG